MAGGRADGPGLSRLVFHTVDSDGTKEFHRARTLHEAIGRAAAGRNAAVVDRLIDDIVGQATLAAFGSTLYLIFTANDASHTLFRVTSTNGTTWTSNVSLSGHTSAFAPSATVMNGFIFVSYIANDGTKRVLVDRTSTGSTWTTFVANSKTSKFAPSAAGFNNGVRLSYISNNASNLLMRMSGSSDGSTYGTETVW